ncbi:MAG TPA: hypothetical protein VI603_13695 [Saprospiraceae bacterium]|nr:hypothetical protein [Saprospiraceae bacterium]
MHPEIDLYKLPNKIKQWLIHNEWEEGARLYLSNAGVSLPKKEYANRKKSLILAIIWYDLHEQGKDQNQAIPKEISNQLNKFFRKPKIESPVEYRQRISDYWYSMCQHAAEYTYANIEPQHAFHCALWGALRMLMDEDLILENVDPLIDTAIEAGFRSVFSDPEAEVSYGIKLSGLNSRLIIPPPVSKSWTDYSDMFIRKVHIQ